MDLLNTVYLGILTASMQTVWHGLNVQQTARNMGQRKRYRQKCLNLKENTSYQYLNTALRRLLMTL